MSEFCMPALGADMEAGTVIQWLVKPGAAIKRGDIIAVVDTEKAAIEIEVFEAGVLEHIVVPEGEKVPVGAVLAIIRRDGEVPTVKPTVEAKPPAPPPKPVVIPSSAPILPPTLPRLEKIPPPQVPHPPTGRLRVSPLAMRVAVECGVDLSGVTGSGPDGAITKADVEQAAAAKAASPVTPVVTPPPAVPAEAAKVPPPSKPTMAPVDRHAAMRRAIAAAIARSKREIPHYYLGTRIDMSRALSWLQAENLKRPVTDRLLYAVLLLKAVAVAVRQFPEMNGF